MAPTRPDRRPTTRTHLVVTAVSAVVVASAWSTAWQVLVEQDDCVSEVFGDCLRRPLALLVLGLPLAWVAWSLALQVARVPLSWLVSTGGALVFIGATQVLAGAVAAALPDLSWWAATALWGLVLAASGTLVAWLLALARGGVAARP